MTDRKQALVVHELLIRNIGLTSHTQVCLHSQHMGNITSMGQCKKDVTPVR